MPWVLVESHSTEYLRTEGGGSRGCFPLCEDCWTLLGCPEARIPYYAMLVKDWEAQGANVTAEERRGIQEAVAAGL